MCITPSDVTAPHRLSSTLRHIVLIQMKDGGIGKALEAAAQDSPSPQRRALDSCGLHMDFLHNLSLDDSTAKVTDTGLMEMCLVSC